MAHIVIADDVFRSHSATKRHSETRKNEEMMVKFDLPESSKKL
jgi:hypothetical protein